MSRTEHRQLARDLLPVTLAAGRLIMSYFGADPDVERKADDSPVTRADREAEALIVEALEKVAPGVPVIGEELASRGEAPPVGDTLFLVDPVDGTRGFIKGRREFTVNIGLVSGGTPVFGIVYAPALDQLFITLAPDEAREARVAPDSRDVELDTLDAKPLSTRPFQRDQLVSIGSKYVSKRMDQRLDELGAKRMFANSSIKFCMIARGDGDLYPRYGRISEWDTAAGAAVLNASGGSVTGLDGAPLKYGKQAVGFANEPFIAWSTPTPPADVLDVLGQG